MDTQEINNLIKKYSQTPNSKQKEEFYSSFSPKASFSPFRDPNSKAYAAAMRALQERIRFLEAENSDLFEKFKVSDTKYQEERKTNEKLSRQLDLYNSSEMISNKELTELKQEILYSRKEISTLQNRIKHLNSPELSEYYKENCQLRQELNSVMRELSGYKCEQISQNLQLRKLEEEKNLLQEELSKEKWRNEELLQDHKNMKSTFDRLKHREYADGEVQRQNSQYLRTIKDLENRCRYLEDSVSKSPEGRKVDENMGSRSSMKTVSFRNSRSKSKTSKSTSPSSPRISKPRNRHIGAHLIESGDFGERILKMESELEQLNKKYKRLLISSKSESNGLGKLRQEIDQLAEELETKGNILYDLKKQQKEGLKKSDSIY